MADAITWADTMRRIANGEPVGDVLDEKSAADRVAFRAFMQEQPGERAALALEHWEQAMRDHDFGLTGARNSWHSISPAQRRVLEALEPGRELVRLRCPRSGYGAVATRSALGSIKRICRLPTVRNLASRGLLDWDGGALDPEARAVLSDRGRFVLAHGKGRDHG